VVVRKKDVEFALTIAAIPVTILILILAGYITRKESTVGMVGIIVSFPNLKSNENYIHSINLTQTLYFGGLAYFVFKLVRMYQARRAAPYLAVRKPLTIFAVITIVLIVVTIVNAIMCASNFRKGLKPYIASRKVESEAEKPNMMEMPNLSHGPVPSRMTID